MAIFTSDTTNALASNDTDLCERHLNHYAEKEGVPLGVLYAVGMTESGKNGKLHPYALNIEGKSLILSSKAAALREFEKAVRNGKKLIDLGCMQVNHHYHRQHFRSAGNMLDPEPNIAYASRFLRELKQEHGSWTMAVARYHASGKNKVAQKRYICAVIRNLVATGFGAWTSDSRAFCGRR